MPHRNAAIVCLMLLLPGCSSPGEKPKKVSQCHTVWEGNFHIRGEGSYNITRKGDYQIERSSDGSVSRFQVDWLDSCSYRLTYLTGNEISKKKKMTVLNVQITEIKDNSYVVDVAMEGIDRAVTVELFYE